MVLCIGLGYLIHKGGMQFEFWLTVSGILAMAIFSVLFLRVSLQGEPITPHTLRNAQPSKTCVYELVSKFESEGKHYAIMFEMKDIQELESKNRTIKFYELTDPLSPGKYFIINPSEEKPKFLPFKPLNPK